MRLLIFSQYFWPESFIINDIAKTLHKLGHKVVVATGKPNYPDGKIYPGYKEQGMQHEIYSEGIDVYRIPLRPRGSGTPREIILNYLSFVTSGLRWFPALLSKSKFDIILVFAPSPITMAIPAIWLKLRRKAHLAIWIQDLWPESLSATGYVKNRFILAMTGLLVRVIYAFADTLLVQSRAFTEPVARYAKREKIIYYPNSSVDIREANPETAVPVQLLELLEENFCVIFAGNIGTAQSVETLVETCAQLRHLTQFRLVIIGSGNMLPWLEDQKDKRNLENLHIAGRFAPQKMWSIFSRAAGLLVSLKKRDIFSYTIPSKVQNYLAAGRPIIGSLGGEGARIIREAGAGLTSAAEDVTGLAQNIEKLYKMDVDERQKYGDSGRRYFLEHFEIERQTQNLTSLLEERLYVSGANKV